jgi:endonuclease YncB( thermonuclease family)
MAVWLMLVGWVLAAALGCQSMSPVKDSERDAARDAMRASVPKKAGEIQEEIKRAQSQADAQEKAQKAQAKADKTKPKAEPKADKENPPPSPVSDPGEVLLAGDPPAPPDPEEVEADTASSSDVLAQALAVPSVAVTPSEDADLALGMYPLDFSKKHPVIDGDTVRVTGLDSSLRLVGIDTEETFKNERDSEAAALSFKDYCDAKRGTGKFPAKFATPLGEIAAEWGRAWLKGVTNVRLEYDETRRKRDIFGRYLVYVFMERDGKWYNYNIEAVRAGMSPYFPKYGYAARYHAEFVAAQEEAKAAKRGIWRDDVEKYPDYPERLTWWNRRAESIKHFQETYDGQPDAVALGGEADWERLKTLEGQEITVFGSLGDSRLDKGAPYIMYMPQNKTEKFGIVATERATLDALGLDKYEGEYFYVRGKVSLYRGTPQFQVADIVRVWQE